MNKQIAWWFIFLICAFFALYAFYLGGVEIGALLGIVADAKYRALPIIFVVHALSGGVVLISGSLQFNRSILKKKRNIHRFIGRTYVYTAWIASVAALLNAIFFDVSLPAKFAFGAVAILWFATTTIAFLRILKRRIREHREWMIRSFSLSLFFVTFSFWVDGLTGTSLPYDVAYPLAVFLSWALNLMVAEIWIRFSRNKIHKILKELQNTFAFG